MPVHAAPGSGAKLADQGVDGLDALLPGLGDAAIDLLDAIHDRTDESGAARDELLDRLAERLRAVWDRTPGTERPLVVLDAMRCVMTSRP